jgi:TetR/AcrR family transcriptional regulator, transcriptional repressor for nem operon
LSFSANRKSASANKILDIAEELAQTRGFNGFSYADIAARLLITKASLHYHFASKAELGRALIVRYHETFVQGLRAIDCEVDKTSEKLRRYVQLYETVMLHDRMCLCGMLAAEYETLPVAMQDELRQFFDANERWLAAVLKSGRRTGELDFRESPDARARLIVGALEGAMLVARTFGDASRFQTAAQHVLGDLRKPSATAARRS